MPSAVLPSHNDVACQGLGRQQREPQTPKAWPGTYVPNFSDWRLGDIVLVEAIGFAGLVIRAGQAVSTNPMMALGNRWSHAAVYVGDGDVVDACYGTTIQRRSLWQYCQGRAVTVRRIDDPAIPAADVRDIAAAALSHVGESYSVLQIVLGKLGWPQAQTPNPDGLYCSTFTGLVVAEATQFELASDPKWQPLFPGVLAMHSDLTSVALEWRNI